jgi:MFS family permease
MHRQLHWRGPLATSYPAAVGLVVCALVPYLMLSAAVLTLAPVLTAGLHLSKATLYLTVSLSTAGYAVGTVLAVQFAVHRPQRRMLLVYMGLFLIASVLVAAAPNGGVFIGGFIVQGLCTSLMLIAAVPPLVIGWPPQKMPITGMVMNLCVFGAVAIGPTLGALFAAAKSWRPLFWIVAAVALLACLFAALTFEDQPAQDRKAPIDALAIAFAVLGCGAAFFGAAELESGTVDASSLAPLIAGVSLIVALVVHQYEMPNPLMPVKQIATTLPTMGIVIAMCVSAGAFGLMELVVVDLEKRTMPSEIATVFLPEFGAAVLTAVVFGALFRTRYTPVLALSGTVALAASAALLALTGDRGTAIVALGTGLLGIGIGASVSPALFLAGFSLRSAQIQRVFAFIELLRGVAAFLFAPILVYLAIAALSSSDGVVICEWICCGLAVLGGLLGLVIFLTGGSGLQVPDLKAWQQGEPAWRSPRLFGRPSQPRPQSTHAPDGRRRRARVASAPYGGR